MEGSYGRVKDLQEGEHDRTMVAKTKSSAWLTTAADMIEAVKCSELTPYKLKNTFFDRAIHMGAKTQDIFFNLDKTT